MMLGKSLERMRLDGLQYAACACKMQIISSFVTNWQFRRIQYRRHGDALVGFALTGKAASPPNYIMEI